MDKETKNTLNYIQRKIGEIRKEPPRQLIQRLIREMRITEIKDTAAKLRRLLQKLIISFDQQLYRETLRTAEKLEQKIKKTATEKEIILDKLILLGQTYIIINTYKPNKKTLDTSKRYFEEALEAAKKAGSPSRISTAAHGIAVSLWELARLAETPQEAKKLLEESKKYDEEALEAAKKAGSPSDISTAAHGIAVSLWELARLAETPQEAKSLLTRSLNYLRMGYACCREPTCKLFYLADYLRGLVDFAYRFDFDEEGCRFVDSILGFDWIIVDRFAYREFPLDVLFDFLRIICDYYLVRAKLGDFILKLKDILEKTSRLSVFAEYIRGVLFELSGDFRRAYEEFREFSEKVSIEEANAYGFLRALVNLARVAFIGRDFDLLENILSDARKLKPLVDRLGWQGRVFDVLLEYWSSLIRADKYVVDLMGTESHQELLEIIRNALNYYESYRKQLLSSLKSVVVPQSLGWFLECLEKVIEGSFDARLKGLEARLPENTRNADKLWFEAADLLEGIKGCLLPSERKIVDGFVLKYRGFAYNVRIMNAILNPDIRSVSDFQEVLKNISGDIGSCLDYFKRARDSFGSLKMHFDATYCELAAKFFAVLRCIADGEEDLGDLLNEFDETYDKFAEEFSKFIGAEFEGFILLLKELIRAYLMGNDRYLIDILGKIRRLGIHRFDIGDPSIPMFDSVGMSISSFATQHIVYVIIPEKNEYIEIPIRDLEDQLRNINPPFIQQLNAMLDFLESLIQEKVDPILEVKARTISVNGKVFKVPDDIARSIRNVLNRLKNALGAKKFFGIPIYDPKTRSCVVIVSRELQVLRKLVDENKRRRQYILAGIRPYPEREVLIR